MFIDWPLLEDSDPWGKRFGFGSLVEDEEVVVGSKVVLRLVGFGAEDLLESGIYAGAEGASVNISCEIESSSAFAVEGLREVGCERVSVLDLDSLVEEAAPPLLDLVRPLLDSCEFVLEEEEATVWPAWAEAGRIWSWEAWIWFRELDLSLSWDDRVVLEVDAWAFPGRIPDESVETTIGRWRFFFVGGGFAGEAALFESEWGVVGLWAGDLTLEALPVAEGGLIVELPIIWFSTSELVPIASPARAFAANLAAFDFFCLILSLFSLASFFSFLLMLSGAVNIIPEEAVNGFEEDEGLLKGWTFDDDAAAAASFGLEVEVIEFGSDLGKVARLTRDEEEAELDRV